jgi:hypothetical protein
MFKTPKEEGGAVGRLPTRHVRRPVGPTGGRRLIALVPREWFRSSAVKCRLARVLKNSRQGLPEGP